jgi:purine nucleosidase
MFWEEKTMLTTEEIKKRLTIPQGKLRLVIDTDAKNELDDQFAIAWALRSKERFQVEAVYAAPFSHGIIPWEIQSSPAGGEVIPVQEGMEQSYEEILKLFAFLGEDPAGRVFRGSDTYLPKEGFVESEAARDLVRRAMEGDELLYVAAIGAITNIASALRMEPKISEKIVVIWLGGQPLEFGHGFEYNLYQDVTAVQQVLDAGVPLVLIPCMNVASLLAVTEDELRAKMLGKSPISSYLAQNCLDAFGGDPLIWLDLNRKGYLLHREDQDEAYLKAFPREPYFSWSRVIWDVSAIGFLKNPNWVPSHLVEAPVLKEDLSWDLTPKGRHPIRVATYCHRDVIFGDMFHCLNDL